MLMGSSADEVMRDTAWCQKHPYPSRVSDAAAMCQQVEREAPLRAVVVSGFFIDRTEVTNARFARWLNRQRDLQIEATKHGPVVVAGETPLVALVDRSGIELAAGVAAAFQFEIWDAGPEGKFFVDLRP